jgi:DNA-binding PadR family transcriptional regulator
VTTRTLHILLALVDGSLHGYGIKQSVEERTRGSVRLGSGTLYEAIHRLVESGDIKEVEPPQDEPLRGGPPRRFYALTPRGSSALREELAGLDEMVRFARRRNLIGVQESE